MKPHVICHMLASIDGRIDGTALRSLSGDGEYEATGAALNGDAWICGRTTMEQHFAEGQPFVSTSKQAAGSQPTYVARQATSYAISVDTLGKLNWASGDVHGDHLICIVSEQAPADYLTTLRDKGISYIVAGKTKVDLSAALGQLGERFGIRTLLLEGGGHINGAFLDAGLVDEVSLLLVPGIDGRHGIPTVFDGTDPARRLAVALKLKSVERREKDTLWIRYDVIRPESK
ncbi:MAG: RibD family protein [Tepidisphaeraceae bacterium]